MPNKFKYLTLSDKSDIISLLKLNFKNTWPQQKGVYC